MGIRTHIPAACLGLAILGISGAALLPAQESEPKRPEVSRRVPTYFGQIGLTPEQKERIYTLLGKHQEQIEALETQIAEAKAQALRDCEAVLTDAQRELLEHRRRAAAQKEDPVPSLVAPNSESSE